MINIRNSKSGQNAMKHYNGVRFYVQEVIKCYEIVFKLLSGQIKPADLSQHLYGSIKLNASIINGLCSGLSFEVEDHKKVTKKGFTSVIATPDKFINGLYLINKDAFVDVFQFLLTNLEEIITGLPPRLLSIEVDLKAKFPFVVDGTGFKEPFRVLLMNNVFSYGKFSDKYGGGLPRDKKGSSKWNRFLFAKMLGIRTCAYCNLNATFTVIDEKGVGVTAPSIDHFFDKAKRPLFALSFYNLIPSCSVCNSTLKNQKNFTLDSHVHPYLGGFENKARFTYRPEDTASFYGFGENISVEFVVDPKAVQVQNSIDCFKLELIYSKYADVIQELILKKLAYNSKYLEIIKDNTYEGLNLTHEEAYRLAFGNYHNEEDFQKRPLAKMTRDIVEELGLV
jgi:hypothetical protein